MMMQKLEEFRATMSLNAYQNSNAESQTSSSIAMTSKKKQLFLTDQL